MSMVVLTLLLLQPIYPAFDFWFKKCAQIDSYDRSSRPDVFCKKGVLKNFAKFTEKHLCQSLFFNKFAG